LILPARRENPAFATTAIFSRFPNKNPENATLAKKTWNEGLRGFQRRQFIPCLYSIWGDNCIMSAAEVIQRIKELPADERDQVARFVAENGGLAARRQFSIVTAADGLPVIRANGGSITSELVHEIESRTP
jgi:hypothetical protein